MQREQDALFDTLVSDVKRRSKSAGVTVKVAGQRAADLIVLSRQGHFVRIHLQGSTADRVTQHADCPVTVVE